MPVCNMCKHELPEPDEAHKVICSECGHPWQLSDDNNSIVLNIEIKKVTTVLSAKQILKGLNNGIRK